MYLQEYDILVYGILCATFPDEDTFPLTCPLNVELL